MITKTDLKGAFRDFLVGGSYRRQVSCNAEQSTSREFTVRELYFMLWYPDQENQADQNGLYLVPDSVVFVGTNVDGNEERDTWYFQDTKSYCAYGAYPNNRTAGFAEDEYYGRVCMLHEEDLFQIVDCQGLADALSDLIARGKRSGKQL